MAARVFLQKNTLTAIGIGSPLRPGAFQLNAHLAAVCFGGAGQEAWRLLLFLYFLQFNLFFSKI
jgi:hypothetical protein